MCSWEGLLDLESEEYVVSFIWPWLRLSSLLHCVHLGVSIHRGQTPAAQPGAHLSLVSVVDLKVPHIYCQTASQKAGTHLRFPSS